jgi:FGGY-family pentulose kinase
MSGLFCAVDVGTRSARAGIYTADGTGIAGAHAPIGMRAEPPDIAEQSSQEIWDAVGAAVRAAMQAAGVPAADIAGIAFDATCSLVLRDREGEPLAASPRCEARWDTICWHDHRAVAEARVATESGHDFLHQLGGTMSPEMQAPKIAWLKRNHPAAWGRLGHLFDLADFLSWKASGSTARSLCTLTTKWAYRADEADPWQHGIHDLLGIADIAARGGLPAFGVPPGADLGPLTQAAAGHLGLTPRCRVAAGMVDAYAGAVGLLGAETAGAGPQDFALIAGTSSCVMTLGTAPLRGDGIWGPFADATIPGFRMSEGGQSATGALLDHLLSTHAAGGAPTSALHGQVARRIQQLREEEGETVARDLHVLPDFHGNRTPHGDPAAAGVVSGLALDPGFDGLCRLYWRSCVAIALGVRQIVEAMAAAGPAPRRLLLGGGHVRNPLLRELYPDVTGLPVGWNEAVDAMLLGTAMAAAAPHHGGLAAASRAMSQPVTVHDPRPAAAAGFARDYHVFLAMARHRQEISRL